MDWKDHNKFYKDEPDKKMLNNPQISPNNILAQSQYCDLNDFVPLDGNFIDALLYWVNKEAMLKR